MRQPGSGAVQAADGPPGLLLGLLPHGQAGLIRPPRAGVAGGRMPRDQAFPPSRRFLRRTGLNVVELPFVDLLGPVTHRTSTHRQRIGVGIEADDASRRFRRLPVDKRVRRRWVKRVRGRCVKRDRGRQVSAPCPTLRAGMSPRLDSDHAAGRARPSPATGRGPATRRRGRQAPSPRRSPARANRVGPGGR